MKRLFIAVDLSIPVVEQMVLFQETIQKNLSSPNAIRWVNAAHIHLTLKFLGDTEPALISNIGTVVKQLSASLFPFEINTYRIGTFPDEHLPRILWAGLDAKSAEVVTLLQQALENDLADIGCPKDERDYYPHITLGRIKSPAPSQLHEQLNNYQDVKFGRSLIKDVILYESVLSPTGPEYLILNRYPLGPT